MLHDFNTCPCLSPGYRKESLQVCCNNNVSLQQKCFSLAVLPSPDGYLSQTITVHGVALSVPLRSLSSLGHSPVILEKEMNQRKFHLVDSKPAPGASLLPVTKGNVVWRCCDDLSSLRSVFVSDRIMGNRVRNQGERYLHCASQAAVVTWRTDIHHILLGSRTR